MMIPKASTSLLVACSLLIIPKKVVAVGLRGPATEEVETLDATETSDKDERATHRNLLCPEYHCPADSTSLTIAPPCSFADCFCNPGFFPNFGKCKSLTGCNYQCPPTSSRIPGVYCYSDFSTCECNEGYELQNGNSCVESKTIAPCLESIKNVQVSEFCVNGNDGNGPGEHMILMNDVLYYPNQATQCAPQNPPGFCKFAPNQCHSLLPGGAFWPTEPGVTIKVGTLENDVYSPGITFASIPTDQWYSPICEAYRIKGARTFTGTFQSVCWEVNNDDDLPIGVDPCSQWTEPDDSYIWTIEVVPIKEDNAGFFPLRRATNPNLCMEVIDSLTTNGALVHMAPCTGADNQLWKHEENYMRSRIDEEKCLDISSYSNGDEPCLWDCREYGQWAWETGEPLRPMLWPIKCLDVTNENRVVMSDCVTSWI